MNNKPTVLTGSQSREVRKLLLNLLKANRLQARRTYYDYYDSCHAPSETPNAEWRPAAEVLSESTVKDFTIQYNGDGLFKLFTGYATYEVKRGA